MHAHVLCGKFGVKECARNAFDIPLCTFAFVLVWTIRDLIMERMFDSVTISKEHLLNEDHVRKSRQSFELIFDGKIDNSFIELSGNYIQTIVFTNKIFGLRYFMCFAFERHQIKHGLPNLIRFSLPQIRWTDTSFAKNFKDIKSSLSLSTTHF